MSAICLLQSIKLWDHIVIQYERLLCCLSFHLICCRPTNLHLHHWLTYTPFTIWLVCFTQAKTKDMFCKLIMKMATSISSISTNIQTPPHFDLKHILAFWFVHYGFWGFWDLHVVLCLYSPLLSSSSTLFSCITFTLGMHEKNELTCLLNTSLGYGVLLNKDLSLISGLHYSHPQSRWCHLWEKSSVCV